MEEKTLLELQKEEALERMRAFKLLPKVIKDFDKIGLVYYSERLNKKFDGILSWITNKPEFRKIISDFQIKHKALVYHAILTHTELGDMLSLLYVCETKEEWDMDWEDLREGIQVAYVANLSNPDFSEFGSIGVKPVNGGLSRTY